MIDTVESRSWFAATFDGSKSFSQSIVLALKLNLPHHAPWLNKTLSSPLRVEPITPSRAACRLGDIDADFLQAVPGEVFELFQGASISLALAGPDSQLMLYRSGEWNSSDLSVARLDLDAMDVGVFMECGGEGQWWEVTKGGEVMPLCAFDTQELAPTCIRHLMENTYAALYRDGRIAIFARVEERVEVLGCWRLSVTPGGVAGTSYFAELAIASSSLLLVSEHHELPDGAHGDLFEAGVVRALLYHEAELLEVGHIAPDLTVARHDATPSVSSACVGPFEGVLHAERVYMRAWPLGWIALDWEPVSVHLDRFEPAGCPRIASATRPIIRAPARARVAWSKSVEDEGAQVLAPATGTLGARVELLIARMLSGGALDTADVAIAALLKRPMPDDLHALLHAWAHAREEVELGEVDWWLHDPPALTEHDLLLGDARWAITLGTTGGGQPYVARIYDERELRILGFDDEGVVFIEARSLERFLALLSFDDFASASTS
jgi:hypothetical protein